MRSPKNMSRSSVSANLTFMLNSVKSVTSVLEPKCWISSFLDHVAKSLHRLSCLCNLYNIDFLQNYLYVKYNNVSKPCVTQNTGIRTHYMLLSFLWLLLKVVPILEIFINSKLPSGVVVVNKSTFGVLFFLHSSIYFLFFWHYWDF